MPDFNYIAREATGGQVTGTLTAGSEQEALSSLAARSLFPVRVDMAKESVSQAKQDGRRVASKHLTPFYSQLADLLKSGVPLLRSLQLLEGQSSNPALKYVINDVKDQVAEGTRLFEAMKKHPKVFSELAISMIRAGEEGSFLEDVLKQIAAFNQHQEQLRGRVIGAMVYPAFLMTVGTAIVIVMLVKFVPEFEGIFGQMEKNGKLPWATTTLMGMSDWLRANWAIAALVIGAIVFGIFQYLKTDEGRGNFDRLRLRSPGVGPIVRSLAIARFTRILGTLLKNGVPILSSLRIAKDATGNRILSDAIGDAADNVSGGKSLAQPLGSSGEFPKEVVEMISVGAEANNLENVLIDIADNQERKTNSQLDMFVRLLEPLMLLIMAGLVVFVIAALLLPVLRMSSGGL
ncbi:MAG: type II secretion system F family protein [Planctomycetaceae bacterium]